MTVWGLFDPVDRVWLGTNEEGTGPWTTPDQTLAEAAAKVAVARCEYAVGRIKARRYDGSGTKLRDTFTPKHSLEKALDMVGFPRDPQTEGT